MEFFSDFQCPGKAGIDILPHSKPMVIPIRYHFPFSHPKMFRSFLHELFTLGANRLILSLEIQSFLPLFADVF
jgi:hypothetical protein